MEFVGYYLDRIGRLKEMRKKLEQQLDLNKTLINDQGRFRMNYDEVRYGYLVAMWACINQLSIFRVLICNQNKMQSRQPYVTQLENYMTRFALYVPTNRCQRLRTCADHPGKP